ncbi:unnamed protein product [Protopolystoma xenopodis]|uniref:Uncharacterized protein n=1 Tax=Protopolystoma xenopodis TaxID=117903 RepID=A0A3S5CEW8_9PLAT|nr:unnamed protein product [Protopolystoma xenopodis]
MSRFHQETLNTLEARELNRLQQRNNFLSQSTKPKIATKLSHSCDPAVPLAFSSCDRRLSISSVGSCLDTDSDKIEKVLPEQSPLLLQMMLTRSGQVGSKAGESLILPALDRQTAVKRAIGQTARPTWDSQPGFAGTRRASSPTSIRIFESPLAGGRFGGRRTELPIKRHSDAWEYRPTGRTSYFEQALGSSMTTGSSFHSSILSSQLNSNMGSLDRLNQGWSVSRRPSFRGDGFGSETETEEFLSTKGYRNPIGEEATLFRRLSQGVGQVKLIS